MPDARAGRDLRELPKVELHLHLEGSIRPATLRDLAARHGEPEPPALQGDRFVWRDFLDFIAQYAMVCRCFADADDLARVARELCEDLAAQGVRYAEVTFTAAAHARRFRSWEAPVEAVLAGLEEGASTTGVRAGVVLDHVRGFPVDVAERTRKVAQRYLGRGVVGLGLGGDEQHPPGPYAEVFARALDGGLHSVPHAGEAAGAASIRAALDLLGAERIGHGIRALEDPDLVAELRERAVPLEVCPTSNVMTGVVPALGEHPFPAMLAEGLVVTLNSDDPGLFGSPLLGEYETARTVWGFDDATLASVAANGVRASFLPDRDKADLLAGIEAWLG